MATLTGLSLWTIAMETLVVRLGERLAKGDRSAFAELYDDCAHRIHHYLVVQLGSRDDADDLLQETFVRLARALEKLAEVENLRAYVFAVARNEALRLLASRSRMRRHETALAADELFCELQDDQEAREAAESLAAALARLSPEEREVVELKNYGGLVLREIAEVTGAPLGTVSTRYRTAMGRLRDWLTRKCHE
jgi:RNA polymerase sigma-70 factor, ECF subfamily